MLQDAPTSAGSAYKGFEDCAPQQHVSSEEITEHLRVDTFQQAAESSAEQLHCSKPQQSTACRTLESAVQPSAPILRPQAASGLAKLSSVFFTTESARSEPTTSASAEQHSNLPADTRVQSSPGAAIPISQRSGSDVFGPLIKPMQCQGLVQHALGSSQHTTAEEYTLSHHDTSPAVPLKLASESYSPPRYNCLLADAALPPMPPQTLTPFPTSQSNETISTSALPFENPPYAVHALTGDPHPPPIDRPCTPPNAQVTPTHTPIHLTPTAPPPSPAQPPPSSSTTLPTPRTLPTPLFLAPSSPHRTTPITPHPSPAHPPFTSSHQAPQSTMNPSKLLHSIATVASIAAPAAVAARRLAEPTAFTFSAPKIRPPSPKELQDCGTTPMPSPVQSQPNPKRPLSMQSALQSVSISSATSSPEKVPSDMAAFLRNAHPSLSGDHTPPAPPLSHKSPRILSPEEDTEAVAAHGMLFCFLSVVSYG